MGPPSVRKRARLAAVPDADWPLDGPLDLALTLRPLVRGQGDRTIRIAGGRAWLSLRTGIGPAVLGLRVDGDRLVGEAWGPGASAALERAPRLAGIGRRWTAATPLPDDVHPLIARLARRHPGVRIARTEAVMDALVPAILEQKVTGAEARRAWHALVRRHGEPAPGPAELGLRLSPPAAALAALPYHAYHPFGVEMRRAQTVRRVASRADAFEAIVDLPLADARTRLLAVPGVGPWTAAEVGVRALGDEDAVSVGDFHLSHLVGFALAGERRADDARMLELLEPYAGHRALVVRLLELGAPWPEARGPRMSPRGIEGI
jgi:3-methyladenine DNA glycosylase/8-oxoguanine DNA glycosylase